MASNLAAHPKTKIKMSKHDPGQAGLIKLDAPPNYELKHLTDEEMKYTIACYCDRCGTQLRMHILFPLVGGKSLEHACVAKSPVLFKIEAQTFEPYPELDLKIFDLDYKYGNKDE